MKRVSMIFISAIGALSSFIAHAQYLGPDYNYNRSASGHVYTVGNQVITSNVGLNEINTTAFRNFAKYYSFLPNANWVKTDDGFTVTAKDRNRVHYRIIFGRHGAMLYEMKYYRDASLSTAVKSLLQGRFKDVIILGIPEITIGNKTFMAIDIYANGIEKIVQLSAYETKILVQFGHAAKPLETFLLLRGINFF